MVLVTHSVDEAVYLSSTIVVMTARPTRIREVVEVPFGYPRAESLHETAEFGEMRAHVRSLVVGNTLHRCSNLCRCRMLTEAY